MHHCMWQNWQSNERLSAGCKNPISHSLCLKKRTTSHFYVHKMFLSVFCYIHTVGCQDGQLYSPTNVTVYLYSSMQILCQFGCIMRFLVLYLTELCTNTFITLKQFSATVSVVSNISHLHLHFLKGFHFAALRQ